MFAFCYTQLYDVEQELNGLYTYERKPKFDMDVIKAINARKAAIEDQKHPDIGVRPSYAHIGVRPSYNFLMRPITKARLA